jgi:hypothetical protein
LITSKASTSAIRWLRMCCPTGRIQYTDSLASIIIPTATTNSVPHPAGRTGLRR